MLAVGPCRERIAVLDAGADDRFGNVSVGVDLYHDGRLLFGKSFEFCGRMLSTENVAADGSSITFRETALWTAKVGARADTDEVLQPPEVNRASS